MVSLTIELTEERVAALKARAEAEGVSLSDLIASVLDRGVSYAFSSEDEDEIMASVEQADRGDVVTEDVAMAALRALSR